LAVTDEKDLPTAQSSPHSDPRVSRPDGYSGRPQCLAPPPPQGPQAPHHLDSAEAARLAPFDRSFSAAARFHHRHEFLRLQREGTRFQTAHFVLYAAIISDASCSRLGITVSRRIGNAVVRNRVKRRTRECFRLELRQLLPPQTALLVIARAGAGQLSSPELYSQLLNAAAVLAHRLSAQL
jgi:ribonuclease P protein component